MPFPCWGCSARSNPKGIRLVLLGLEVFPVSVLVLPFNVDGHRLQIPGLLFMVFEEVIWLCGSLPLKNGMKQVEIWKLWFWRLWVLALPMRTRKIKCGTWIATAGKIRIRAVCSFLRRVRPQHLPLLIDLSLKGKIANWWCCSFPHCWETSILVEIKDF